MITDLTRGKPLKQIFAFAIPMALSTFAQLLYSIGDMAVVGRTLGQDAVGAIGSCHSLISMILFFFTGLTGGMSIIISQRFGASDTVSMRKSITICFTVSTVVSILGSILPCAACTTLLRWMNTPEELFDYSRTYMLVILGGTFTTSWACLTAGILRALGDSRMPLLITVIAAVLNILLDLLFIKVFHWGIGGAAFTTQLVHLVSAFLCIAVMSRYPLLHLKRSDWRMKRKFVAAHIKIGLPVALQSSLIGIGSVVLQSVLNKLGPTAVTGAAIGSRIELISITLMWSVGAAILTFAGQNYGARLYDRITTGINQSFAVLCGFAVVMWILMQLFHPQLAALYIGTVPEELMEYIRTYLRIAPSFHLLLVFICVYRNAVQGMGFTRIVLITSIAELLARCISAPVFAGYFGFKGACFADPCAWLASIVILAPYYFVKMNALRKKQRGIRHAVPLL